jgi:large subunit ribosomal protein L17
MRFAMTARTIARQRGEGEEMNEMTKRNVEKVTRFRPDGQTELEKMVEKLNDLEVGERNNAVSAEKRWGGKV